MIHNYKRDYDHTEFATWFHSSLSLNLICEHCWSMGYACLQLNMKAVRDDVIHYAISHSPGAKHEFHISNKALKQGTFRGSDPHCMWVYFGWVRQSSPLICIPRGIGPIWQEGIIALPKRSHDSSYLLKASQYRSDEKHSCNVSHFLFKDRKWKGFWLINYILSGVTIQRRERMKCWLLDNDDFRGLLFWNISCTAPVASPDTWNEPA